MSDNVVLLFSILFYALLALAGIKLGLLSPQGIAMFLGCGAVVFLFLVAGIPLTGVIILGLALFGVVAAKSMQKSIAEYDPHDQHTYKITDRGPKGSGPIIRYYTGPLMIGDVWVVTDIDPNAPNVKIIA